MKLLKDLFMTDYGLLSTLVIAFILVMAGWFIRFFVNHSHDPAPKE